MCDVIITNSELDEVRREGWMLRFQSSLFEKQQECVEIERHETVPGFNSFGFYMGED